MLLIITPNPALDRTMVFSDLRLGGVHRTGHVLVAAGGKGLNVARAARALGQSTLVCGPLGGHTGEQVAHLAAEEGLLCRWSNHGGGETRTCVLVVDASGATDATALNEVGPPLGARGWKSFADEALEASASADLCAVAGSLPPGVPATALGALIRTLAERGCRVVVDTSGPALAGAIAARPWGLKVNGAEAGEFLGRPVTDVAAAAQVVDELRDRGLELAAVSLGALGCVAADAAGVWWACPPTVAVQSTVGSGDSLTAGLLTGLLRGQPLPEALCLGVACGAADATTPGPGQIDQAAVAHLVPAVTVKKLR
jgi:1-phosphofructokinase family hexose kinase